MHAASARDTAVKLLFRREKEKRGTGSNPRDRKKFDHILSVSPSAKNLNLDNNEGTKALIIFLSCFLPLQFVIGFRFMESKMGCFQR